MIDDAKFEAVMREIGAPAPPQVKQRNQFEFPDRLVIGVPGASRECCWYVREDICTAALAEAEEARRWTRTWATAAWVATAIALGMAIAM